MGKQEEKKSSTSMLIENEEKTEQEKLMSVTITSPVENVNIPDNLSSNNSFGGKNFKTSYYVRDKVQPMK